MNIIEKFEVLEEIVSEYKVGGVELESVREDDGWPVAPWEVEELEEEGVALKNEISFSASGEDEAEDEEVKKLVKVFKSKVAELGLKIERESTFAKNSALDHVQVEGVKIWVVE